MPEQSSAVEIAHPPQALLKVVNPALNLALRSPLGSAMKDFMVVSFTGRKTGRQFSVPVSAHRIDGELYVILNAGWKYNFKEGASAEVRHAGKTRKMRGQLITDSATVAQLAVRAATSYGAKKAQRSMGMKFRGDAVPTVEQFTRAANEFGVAAIRLTPL